MSPDAIARALLGEHLLGSLGAWLRPEKEALKATAEYLEGGSMSLLYQRDSGGHHDHSIWTGWKSVLTVRSPFPAANVVAN